MSEKTICDKLKDLFIKRIGQQFDILEKFYHEKKDLYKLKGIYPSGENDLVFDFRDENEIKYQTESNCGFEDGTINAISKTKGYIFPDEDFTEKPEIFSIKILSCDDLEDILNKLQKNVNKFINQDFYFIEDYDPDRIHLEVYKNTKDDLVGHITVQEYDEFIESDDYIPIESDWLMDSFSNDFIKSCYDCSNKRIITYDNGKEFAYCQHCNTHDILEFWSNGGACCPMFNKNNDINEKDSN